MKEKKLKKQTVDVVFIHTIHYYTCMMYAINIVSLGHELKRNAFWFSARMSIELTINI